MNSMAERTRIRRRFWNENELSLYRGQLCKRDLEDVIPEAIRAACRQGYSDRPVFAEEFAKRFIGAYRTIIWPDYRVGDKLIGLAPLGMANFPAEFFDAFAYDLYIIAERLYINDCGQALLVKDIIVNVRRQLNRELA